VKKCPQCGLVNPPAAELCDCGYSFLDRRATRPHQPGEKLTPLDIGVAVLLPPVGLILGLLRALSGKSSGWTLVAIAIVSSGVGWLVSFVMLSGNR
jgi:hypothetical protein